MDIELLKNVLALRYRLQWAQVRSRNGKIAVFMVGYLFALLIGAMALLGGIGAGVAAIRFGKAELVARIVLGSVFLTGVVSSIFLGLGTSDPFTDVSLRRYPMTTFERFLVRHGTAFLEPFWIILLAADIGFAIALGALGAAAWLQAVPAVLLLVIANYLAARAVMAGVAHLLAGRRTRAIAIGCALAIPIGVQMAPWLARFPSARNFFTSLTPAGAALPSSIAAAAMLAPAARSALSLLALLAWIFAIGALLVALDRRPLASGTRGGAKAEWRHPCDRIAAWFGPTMAPLAGKMLRYYIRSPQVRYNFPLVIPMLAMFAMMTGKHEGTGPMALFLSLLGLMPWVALCTGALSLNIFGFDGKGFRRYFLMPVTPSTVVRTAGLVAMIPGLTLTFVALLAWIVFSPVSSDVRTTVMLACSAITGLFIFHAGGLWTSVLAPRPIPFTMSFGNRLSLLANAFLIAWVFACVGLRALFVARVVGDGVLAFWWVGPLGVACSASLFFISIQGVARLMVARREISLVLIEGIM